MKNIHTSRIKKRQSVNFVTPAVSITMYAFCFLIFGCKNNNINNAKNVTGNANNSQTINLVDKDLAETASMVTYKKNNTINNIEKRYQDLITVSLSGKERKLPVYGFNGNNTNGLPWTNKPFRDSVASLQIKAIRYPGGSESNLWDWQNGWFEKKGSNSVLLAKQKQLYSPSGLKELKVLVEQTGCDVFFVLNMISRSVNDQLQMLKSAQSLGIPVKFIELGNELNLKNSAGKSVIKTSLEYGKTCDKWITVIKSSFPEAKIAVVGGDLSYNEDVKNWNKTVLQLAPKADAVVAHIYGTPDKFIENSNMNFEKLGKDFMEKYNNRGFGAIKDNKEIWVTEYNIQWAANNEGASKEQLLKNHSGAFTWGQSLATLYMTSFITSISDKIKVILNHNIAGSSMFAAIEASNGEYRKLPNGIGMEIWLKASNNMTTMEKLNFFNSQNNSYLKEYDLFGWEFSNGNQKKLLIVNLSGKNSQLDLSSFAKSNLKFEIVSSDKQTVIKTPLDIKRIAGTQKDNIIDMPPFSALTISL